MNKDYDYTIDDLTNARADGWDDCRKLILKLIDDESIEVGDNKLEIDESLLDKIKSEDFGIIDSPIVKISQDAKISN